MITLKDLPENTVLTLTKVRLTDALYNASSLPTYNIKSKDVYLRGYVMGDFFVKTDFKSTQIYPMFNDLLSWHQLKDLEVIDNSLNELYVLAKKKIDIVETETLSNYCNNGSGTLWESVWKFKDSKFMQQTITNGTFRDWNTFDNKDTAIDSMMRELQTIKKVRDE